MSNVVVVEVLQEAIAARQHDEVAERDADEEQERDHQHQRQRDPPLAGLNAGRTNA